jgi:hypothetical protein
MFGGKLKLVVRVSNPICGPTEKTHEKITVNIRRRRRSFLFSAFFLMVGVPGAVGGSPPVPKG